MKNIILALLFFATTSAMAQPAATKVKPAHPTAPPAAQTQARALMRRTHGAIGTLSASLVGVDNKSVSLRWNNPEDIDGIFDDFESHDDFVINSPGTIGWSYIDADNADTYTWTAADFPNQGQPMAFIVFNPSKTSPSTATWPDIQPYSGEKMLIDFTVEGGNNDYIISPQLNFEEDFQFSFQARSYTDYYGKERFRVGYSTTGSRPSDFTYIQDGNYAEVPAEWTLCQYTIPRNAKYVCINCVSQDAFMFMVDDIFIGTNHVRPAAPAKATNASQRLEGFNLLRNGVQVNDTLLTHTTATDEVPEYGTYTYTVQAVMTDGTVSATSEPLRVEVPDIRLLPFEDDFDDNTIDEDRWERPIDDSGNENKWKCDYYAYGLVDYSACYPYSRIGNDYSQSLITSELRTLNAANTYLRFQVRLDNNVKNTGSYLSAEVTTDDGQTWTSLVDIANDEGFFTWRTYEYALNDVLGGAEFFKVRFRAHGADSWNINYWYLDDVKIWCPETCAAQVTVVSGGQPKAGANVTLIADNGAEYKGLTDNQGHFDLSRMELGDYTVTVEAEGCNLYTGEWELTADGTHTLQVVLTRPVMQWSTTNIDATLAQEAEEDCTLTLSNNGDGALFWNLTPEPKPQSGTTLHQFEIGQSFDASGDLQASVGFDGEYFFTASNYTLGRYYKYDRDGHFIEEFSIPGMYYKLYDLAYDGTYFYGSDLSNHIFQLDMRGKRLIREWEVKDNASLTITHMAYDPRSDQFWVGDWTKLGRVDREGNVTVDFFSIGESGDDMAVIGSAFDNVSEGGPYLWLSNLSTSGLNQVDYVTIMQYDLGNRRLTNITHSAIDVPNYKTGTEEMGYNNLGGIELTTRLVPGQLTLVGILQQSPSRIFTYRIADYDSWYSVSPMSGTLDAGDQTTINVHFDARDFALNETREASLHFGSLPTLESEHNVALRLTANALAAQPRPISLTATTDEANNKVVLAWQAAENSQPVAYEVLRDSDVIATLTATTYEDTNLVRGKYAYAVRALYGEERVASALSDTACAVIKVGASYFAPISLQASLANNKEVTLSWQKPDALLHESKTLRWCNASNDDAVGISGGGYFYAGIAFDADDLDVYRGMQISSVDVFIKERVLSLSLKVYQDGKSILTKRVATDNLKYGEYNTVELDEPITIERGSEYRVAFLIMHDADLRPLGTSSGKTVEGKSNLMSEDGRTWYPASYAGFSNINFNIAVGLEPSENYTEEPPSAYRILRDGQEVGTSTTTLFSEKLTEPATYEYQVVSLYDGNGVSAASNTARVTVEYIGKPQAPRSLSASVERNRKVTLHWNFPLSNEPTVPVDLTTSAGTSPTNRPEFVSAFRGAFTGEMGFASDGNYVYTTRHSVAGVVNRYLMDGTFDESFSVSSALSDGFSNLTFDGSDFWAAGKTSYIYKLDMESHSIADTRSISEVARHLAYVPVLDEERGGFEVGDWETSINVTMQGAKLSDGPTLKGAAGSAYYDGVLYTFEQGYDTAYELCARDFSTGELLWHNSITDWTAITPSSSASAGGMSVLHTAEGLHLLCVALQEPAGTRFIYLDLGSIKGLAGYNVYRNGVKVNEEPLPQRYFEESLSEPGDYTYQVQTVYVDGSTSALSEVQTITIVPATPGDAPTDVKARAMSVGYDVNISMVDPTAQMTDQYYSFEDGVVADASGFVVSNKDGYAGSRTLKAPAETECELILPINKTYEVDFALSFVARTLTSEEGAGSVQVLTSQSTTEEANFINLASVSTAEAWKQYSFTLPAATRYVALRCGASYVENLIDAITINASQPGEIYGYDIMRGDEIITNEPTTNVSYVDHNLLPGTYTYKVRAHYNNASVSEWSDAVSVELDYSNGHQAPGHLSVAQDETGNVLTWSVPALSGVKELRWHNGVSSGAAGLPSGGSYYAGVQFDATDLADYFSLSVSQISFYVNQVPDVLFVQLYEDQELVFEKYVTGLRQYSMNTVQLDSPIPVNAAKSLRAVIYVEHNSITVPLGYDEGPARTGRGDLYSSDGVTWETLTDNEIDGNWNITIGLQAYASASTPQTEASPINGQMAERYVRHAAKIQTAEYGALCAQSFAVARSASSSYFSGYNVYCNGEQLNASLLGTDATTYTDEATHKGRYYEYQVKAVYPDYGEVGSNVVRILSTGIEGIENSNKVNPSVTYTIDGRCVTDDYRGPVIVDGQKRIR